MCGKATDGLFGKSETLVSPRSWIKARLHQADVDSVWLRTSVL